jgi:hypothetical protein
MKLQANTLGKIPATGLIALPMVITTEATNGALQTGGRNGGCAMYSEKKGDALSFTPSDVRGARLFL